MGLAFGVLPMGVSPGNAARSDPVLQPPDPGVPADGRGWVSEQEAARRISMHHKG